MLLRYRRASAFNNSDVGERRNRISPILLPIKNIHYELHFFYIASAIKGHRAAHIVSIYSSPASASAGSPINLSRVSFRSGGGNRDHGAEEKKQQHKDKEFGKQN